MTVERPIRKLLLRPITAIANSAMYRSEFQAITRNLLEERAKSHLQGAVGFGFASHWLKTWRDIFKPITKNRYRNRVITFDSHLKTALSCSPLRGSRKELEFISSKERLVGRPPGNL